MVPFILSLFLLLRLGFAWEGEEKGWVRVSLPPLQNDDWTCAAISNLFYFGCLAFSVSFARLSERKGFLGAEFVDLQRLFATTCLFPSAGTR